MGPGLPRLEALQETSAPALDHPQRLAPSPVSEAFSVHLQVLTPPYIPDLENGGSVT